MNQLMWQDLDSPTVIKLVKKKKPHQSKSAHMVDSLSDQREKKCSCQIDNIRDEVDNLLRKGAKKCESRRQSRLNTPSYVRDLVSREKFVGTKK